MKTTSATPVPLLDLRAQYESLRDEVHDAVDGVLESQRFILGPEVEALEQEVAYYSQCEHAVGVSSGTDALLAALMAVGVGPGDEVITTAYSFFASAGSIARLGAKPVFVDIEPHSYNIDPTLLESVVTGRTRAIVPVHLFGQVAEMGPIMEIADRHNLFVIEDAAQAIGAELHGRRAGSFGHLGCFSFYPSKNLGAFGDGGMVTSNEPDLADKVRLIRGHGARPKYFNKVLGGNFRLDALQAAVLRVKLRHLDSWNEARQRNAGIYRRLFTEAELVESSAVSPDAAGSETSVDMPTELPDRCHIYNQFVIETRRRDELAAFLKERKIGTEIYYPAPLHLLECFAELGHRPGDCPASELAADRSLALPIYPELTEEMIGVVVDAVGDFCSGALSE
jgi:dTDP-4-amino-4,6-dideoxygalactose transaminase